MNIIVDEREEKLKNKHTHTKKMAITPNGIQCSVTSLAIWIMQSNENTDLPPPPHTHTYKHMHTQRVFVCGLLKSCHYLNDISWSLHKQLIITDKQMKLALSLCWGYLAVCVCVCLCIVNGTSMCVCVCVCKRVVCGAGGYNLFVSVRRHVRGFYVYPVDLCLYVCES